MSFTKKVVAGQTIAAADFAKFFGDHFSEFVKTGFEVTEGTGLVVDISAGTAYVKDASGYMYQIVSDATETTTLADDSTNYVFLHSNNGATYITDSTSATVPDDAILLATVVCASGDVTSVTDNRSVTPSVGSLGFMLLPNTSTANAKNYLHAEDGLTMKIRNLKFTATNLTSSPIVWGKVYVNTANSEVEVWSSGGLGVYGTTTADVAINMTNDSDFEAYIKWAMYASGYVNYTNIRLSYEISE